MSQNQNPGQIRFQKNVVAADATGKDTLKSNDEEEQNALFSKADFPGQSGEPANAIMLGLPGKVKVHLVDGRDESVPSDEEGAQLIPGCWHGCEPFDHVYDTGTDAVKVKVGVTW
jgi:hypothetical protein